MADNEERRRILDMLAIGQINADEAGELLSALSADVDDKAAAAMRETQAHLAIVGGARDARKEAAKRITKSLRIVIESGGENEGKRARVQVTVPLGLAKFAGKLIPEEARLRIEDQGIELAELLQALDQEMPEGRLIDIDTAGEGASDRARIVVEVV